MTGTSLLHLFSEWLVRDCVEPRCRTTDFGDPDIEATDRLAEHGRHCHGHA